MVADNIFARCILSVLITVIINSLCLFNEVHASQTNTMMCGSLFVAQYPNIQFDRTAVFSDKIANLQQKISWLTKLAHAIPEIDFRASNLSPAVFKILARDISDTEVDWYWSDPLKSYVDFSQKITAITGTGSFMNNYIDDVNTAHLSTLWRHNASLTSEQILSFFWFLKQKYGMNDMLNIQGLTDTNLIAITTFAVQKQYFKKVSDLWRQMDYINNKIGMLKPNIKNHMIKQEVLAFLTIVLNSDYKIQTDASIIDVFSYFYSVYASKHMNVISATYLSAIHLVNKFEESTNVMHNFRNTKQHLKQLDFIDKEIALLMLFAVTRKVDITNVINTSLLIHSAIGDITISDLMSVLSQFLPQLKLGVLPTESELVVGLHDGLPFGLAKKCKTDICKCRGLCKNQRVNLPPWMSILLP